jgi:hypothetical protein
MSHKIHRLAGWAWNSSKYLETKTVMIDKIWFYTSCSSTEKYGGVVSKLTAWYNCAVSKKFEKWNICNMKADHKKLLCTFIPAFRFQRQRRWVFPEKQIIWKPSFFSVFLEQHLMNVKNWNKPKCMQIIEGNKYWKADIKKWIKKY